MVTGNPGLGHTQIEQHQFRCGTPGYLIRVYIVCFQEFLSKKMNKQVNFFHKSLKLETNSFNDTDGQVHQSKQAPRLLNFFHTQLS